MKTFTQITSGRGRKVNNFDSDVISKETLMELFEKTDFTYPLQRDASKRAETKAVQAYLGGNLTGSARIFTAVYVLDLKQFWIIDGYTRFEMLRRGLSDFPMGVNPILQTFVLQTAEDARKEYHSHNSAVASKTSSHLVEGGARAVSKLNEFKSDYIGKPYGLATALQLATGHNKAKVDLAVIDAIEALTFIDDMLLVKNPFEKVGTKGAFIASALECSHLELVEDFIRKVNQSEFSPIKASRADGVITRYRNFLIENQPVIGGRANQRSFIEGLRAFINFSSFSLKIRVNASDVMAISNLAGFRRLLEKLGIAS